MVDRSITHDERGKKRQLRHQPDIKTIEKDLIAGKPYLEISHKYNVDRASLSRYKKKYLAQKVNKYEDKKDYREGNALYSLLTKYIDNVNQVTDACMRELQDPENPDRIYVGSQAKDITVMYTGKDGNKHKESLQEIINDKLGITPSKIEVNSPDRVQTMLNASHAMSKHIRLFAELKGMLGSVGNNIVNQPVFREFIDVVLKAMADYPEARDKIAEYVRSISSQEITDVTVEKDEA